MAEWQIRSSSLQYQHLMASPNKSSVASNISRKSSHDSLEDIQESTPMSHEEALHLAHHMYQGMKPHIKDRIYRFKSYKSCFKHSHAVAWAIENIDTDKRVAVTRLNEMIDLGLVSHVVDPSKKFRVQETRTLYFRFNQIFFNEQQHDPDTSRASADNGIAFSVNGKHRSLCISQSIIAQDQLELMQNKIEGLDHILGETMKELNSANGRLELMHQKICTLLSQQLSMFGMILILAGFSMSQVFRGYTSYTTLFSRPGCLAAFLMIILSKCGISLFNSCTLLYHTPISSAEVAEEEESTFDDSAPSKVIRTYTKKPSFTKIVSERFGAVVRGKSSNRLSTIAETSVVLARDAYSLPDVETWPHRPLLICANTPVSIHLKVPHYGLGACPLGKPFKFSSDLFEGTCLIRIKDSNSDDRNGDSEYFAGRKRIFQSVVQGRFKEEGLCVSDVLTGHEFSRPLKHLPHPWILSTASNFIGRVAPGSNVVVHTNQPLVEAILAGTSQAVRGDEPGNEPNILTRTIQEDCSIFGGAFAKDVSIPKRKRILSNPEKAKQYTFDTETIYTFEFYQNLFDANSYALDLGFTKIGCSKVLDGQPIQWLGKLRDGRYLWSFQIWHEKLLSEGDAAKD